MHIHEPSSNVVDIIKTLINLPIPDSKEAIAQTQNMRVADIEDRDGSLRIYPNLGAPLINSTRVPVVGFCRDSDGVILEMLLHIVDGRLYELEFYKVDGSERIDATIDLNKIKYDTNR